MKRFDNITDEEIEEGIREIEAREKRLKSPIFKISIWLIVILCILILIIGYEVAPNFSENRAEYFLDWLFG